MVKKVKLVRLLPKMCLLRFVCGETKHNLLLDKGLGLRLGLPHEMREPQRRGQGARDGWSRFKKLTTRDGAGRYNQGQGPTMAVRGFVVDSTHMLCPWEHGSENCSDYMVSPALPFILFLIFKKMFVHTGPRQISGAPQKYYYYYYKQTSFFFFICLFQSTGRNAKTSNKKNADLCT